MRNRLLGAFLAFFCLVGLQSANAEMFIQQQNMTLGDAVTAISQALQLKLSDNLDADTKKQVITQDLRGDGKTLLKKLADIYDLDWYIYGSILAIQSSEEYINYTYKPRNISAENLLQELNYAFDINDTTAIELVERGHSLLLSGTRRFVNDVVSYALMVDRNEFLEEQNALEVTRIKFNHLSVLDRQIESFEGPVTFPGAQSILIEAITNIGKFETAEKVETEEGVSQSLEVSEGEVLVLDENERTTRIIALPAINTVLIRGTPAEIALARDLAKFIDVKRNGLMFTLRVYDVAVERSENIGMQAESLNIASNIYDLVTLPFSNTVSFLQSFNALTSNGTIRSLYETNLLTLDNQRAHFGRKEVATIALVSNREVLVEEIEADNSLYITGTLQSDGSVQAKIEYIEEELSDDSNSSSTNTSNTTAPPRVSSQSLLSEVNIKPNQTAVVGGFNITETTSMVAKVPVLGSIPLVGQLFSSTQEKKRSYKRYISVSHEVVN